MTFTASRSLVAAIAGALIALSWPVPATAQEPPNGFTGRLAGPGEDVYVECYDSAAFASQMQCRLYGPPDRASGTCDFGGKVPTVELPVTGPPRHGYQCIDEGYHGWSRLDDSSTWTSGAFRCKRLSRMVRNRLRGKVECFNGDSLGFSVSGNGSVDLTARPTPPERRRFCARFDGGPATGVVRIYAHRVTCRTARRLYRRYYQGKAEGWRCFVEGTPNTDDVEFVMCGRRSGATVRWTYG